MVFHIERILSAEKIIEFSEKNGLYDVKLWIDLEEAQESLDSEKWVAYLAKNINNEKSESMIGAIIGGFEDEGRLWIELLTVSESLRKRSIGRSLISKLCQCGKIKGYRACFVDVDDDNYNGIRFYRKVGFKKVGKIKNYYYDNQSALIFMKTL